MILQALTDYYQRIADAPDSTVAGFGFSLQKISFAVVIDPNGNDHQVQAVGVEKKGKRISQPMVVLGMGKPSGSGINPCFLWDNLAYILGLKADDPKPERTLQSFEAFREKHLELEKEIDDEHFALVCKFLRDWNPATADSALTEMGTGFGVFRIRGVEGYVHNRPAIRKWWITQVSEQSAGSGYSGQCLVSGEHTMVARLHEPKIKGVAGAQSSGASIVSFNLDAFESYGKSQSYNAPVSEQAAFEYATGLNQLLAGNQRFQIGDATTVYWTDKPSPIEDFLGNIINDRPQDDELKNSLDGVLRAISKGHFPPELGDPTIEFYVLGLSPNASRVSIRFWYQNNVGQLVESLGKHFADLSIIRSDRDPEFPTAWQLLRETARESKDISPLLSGGLMRAMLNANVNYPNALYGAILRRIGADRRISAVRCAVLKAYLNRSNLLERKIEMGLDTEREEPAYHMGRLFAGLEKTQEDAIQGINDTIKDRYFGAASATPASVFPRLIRMNQHHMGKLEKGKRIYFERMIQAICSQFDSFPSHLNMHSQGLFALGYYHQRQQMFMKKPVVGEVTT